MGAGSGLGAPALLPPSTDGLSRRGSAAYVEAATPRRGKTSPFNWHRGASSSRGAATAWLWDTAGHEPSGGSERDRDSVTQRPFSRGLPQPTESPVALTRGAGPNQDSPWEAPRHFSHPKKNSRSNFALYRLRDSDAFPPVTSVFPSESKAEIKEYPPESEGTLLNWIIVA